MENQPSYLTYWGKAAGNDSSQFHLLVHHCLDVAAVAAVWWELSPRIRHLFCHQSKLSQEQIRAWILFFIALHDIGKFDLRFQRKVKNIWRHLQKPSVATRLSPKDSQKYFHGPAGLYWLKHEFDEIIFAKNKNRSSVDDDLFDLFDDSTEEESSNQKAWKPWIEAVTGHHGHIVSAENNLTFPLPRECPKKYSIYDKNARKEWLRILESIFLKPAGLSLRMIPPKPPSPSFLAGFCSVADWLGSANSESRFCYLSDPDDLSTYFEHRHEDASDTLRISGLIGKPKPFGGIRMLLREGHTPHQIQTVIDKLICLSGLTIIEAPTGSGKTEAALTYAWRLLEKEMADGIIFALPTQATANAMLNRLERLSTKLFEYHPNLLLAHGNARFNADFTKLRDQRRTAQDDEEAWAQCSQWLAQSRKRAFLGQIGVCTIDQVLTAVLPIRHRFIRSFGLGRSVLIVDEVHAYDTYMYGLLKEVLLEQASVFGSAVLLSATLPHFQRQELFCAWNRSIPVEQISGRSPYPVISQLTSKSIETYTVTPQQMPPQKRIRMETLVSKECYPAPELIQRIIRAADTGAKVAVICNLVDVTQQLFRELRNRSKAPVMLFHSRFTLTERQEIERTLLHRFGPDADWMGGALLIATQVVEQSLDLDFDWMISQICPVDLLFQRLGRLHRHAHKNSSRPKEFAQPQCAVLVPEGLDYGLHGLIYANVRVLWRTTQKLFGLKDAPLIFPEAYRDWIEAVYQEAAWGSEPAEIEKGYQKFIDEYEFTKRQAAKLMVNSAKNMMPVSDNDQHVIAVTRDGPMRLTILPFLNTRNGCVLRNGSILENLHQNDQLEAIAMNTIYVPNTWQGILEKHVQAKDGIYRLPMEAKGETWQADLGEWVLQYDHQKGLEKIE